MSPVIIQRRIALLAFLLLIIKVIAWRLTNSVAIFTDASESVVNVIAGFIGWYSLWLAAKPKDMNHPYGHGKVEFISASIEGTLISIAGIIIIYQSVHNYFHPHPIQQLDMGIILVTITAIVNFIVGMYAIKKGKQSRSIALESSGKHLCTDTYSTLGIVVGLIVIAFTQLFWLDSIIAFVIGIIIIISGVKIIRKSLAGIMDEADTQLLQEIITFLNENRQVNWIDLHNLRVIKYGSVLHIDAHLTLPYFFTVKEAHKEVEMIEQLIQSKYGESVELFIHVDGCQTFSCYICNKQDCRVRSHPYQKTFTWNLDNVLLNQKHQNSD